MQMEGLESYKIELNEIYADKIALNSDHMAQVRPIDLFTEDDKLDSGDNGLQEFSDEDDDEEEEAEKGKGSDSEGDRPPIVLSDGKVLQRKHSGVMGRGLSGADYEWEDTVHLSPSSTPTGKDEKDIFTLLNEKKQSLLFWKNKKHETGEGAGSTQTAAVQGTELDARKGAVLQRSVQPSGGARNSDRRPEVPPVPTSSPLPTAKDRGGAGDRDRDRDKARAKDSQREREETRGSAGSSSSRSRTNPLVGKATPGLNPLQRRDQDKDHARSREKERHHHEQHQHHPRSGAIPPSSRSRNGEQKVPSRETGSEDRRFRLDSSRTPNNTAAVSNPMSDEDGPTIL